MAEYLSPGVYVEEFDSGVKAMEGVGTSTAGFVGMAQKGPVRGLPVLITSMADYQRRFGGYLSERTYGKNRFLPYAVEQFFNNGGSSCYVMRVCKQDDDDHKAKGKICGAADQAFLELKASNPGAWGNSIKVKFALLTRSRTRLTGDMTVKPSADAGKKDNVRSDAGRPDHVKADAGRAGTAGAGNGNAVRAGEPGGITVACELEDTSALQVDDMICLQKAEKNSSFFFGVVQEIDGKNVVLTCLTEEAVHLKDAGPEDPSSGGTDPEDPSSGGTDPKDPSSGGTDPEDPSSGGTVLKDSTTGGVNPKDPSSGDTDPKNLMAENTDPKTPVKGGNEPPEVFLYLAEWGVTIQDDTSSEQYENVSFNPNRSNYIDHVLKKSQILSVTVQEKNLTAGMIEGLLGKEEELSIVISLTGGADDSNASDVDPAMYRGGDGAPDMRTGLMAFKTLSDVSIMAIPGITDKTVQSDLVSHCESMGNRFAILDMPLEDKEVSELQEFRENVDSSYAAMYHPWLQCYDPLVRRNVSLPPSGAVAGIYGRTDNTRGVHKAPANEIVRNCTGLSVNYNEMEQGKLNPRGINLIRALPGQGIRVWGARTCSSDGNWKYVNVRRLFIFIEESIRINTNWAVFEPNDEMLWSRVEGTIRVFLTAQWRNGALAGSTADEAFFINIGKSTMTEDDILNGRLICVIGVAPVRPAEFVVFRITQKMESAQ